MHNLLVKVGFKTIILLFAINFINFNPVNAANISSTANGGNWSAKASWTGGKIPGSGDNVTITNGATITVNTTTSAGSIILSGGGSATSLTISGTNSLHILGAATIAAGTTTQTIAVNDGTLQIDGNLTLTGGNSTRVAQLTIGTGTATINGNLVLINGGGGFLLTYITFTGAGTLNLGGSLTNGGSFTPSTGTVNYYGAAQTVATYTYYDLTLSGSGIKTTTGVTVNDTLSMEGTATASVAPTYGTSATLQYNITTARNSGVEWITPFVATGGVVIANSGIITINSSLTLTSRLALTGGKVAIGANTLTLNGNFRGSATNCLTGGASSNLVIGNTGIIGTLYIDQSNVGTSNRLQNLTINRVGQTITLGNIFEVTGTVTLSNGTLASTGNLTLVSNAAGTARIGQINGTGAITGNVTVQRFIPGGNAYDRAYRFLASPASGQTFAAAWQQDIHITGPGTGGSVCPTMTANSNGFDNNSSTISSIYTYSEITGAWTAISNTNATTLNSATAYRAFIRGNRTQGCALLTTPYATAQSVTLKATGTITTGAVNKSLTYTTAKGAGWNLVTNPYPSAIDWANASWVAAKSANISSTIYVWNPKIGTAGAYASYNSFGGGSVNGGSNIIQSGQAFFVKTTASATLSFQEAYKSTDQSTQLFGKSSLPNNLKIQLKDTAVTDEAVIFTYNGASHNIENADGQKMSFGTGSVGTYTSSNDTTLTFNAVEPFEPINIDTIYLKTGLAASNSYTLNFIGAKSFDTNIRPYLYDTYTSTLTDLTSYSSYSFTTNTIAGSISQTRFYLIFANPSSLPVVLTNFKAEKTANTVTLKWNTSSEINSSVFVVERSNDAINFKEIANIKAAGNSYQNINYSTIDEQPNLLEVNYYRLKQIDVDGKYSYSSVDAVDFKVNDKTPTINIWPNPVSDVINIGCSVKPNELVLCEIFDVTGKTISTFNFLSTLSYETKKDVSFLNVGVYFIKIKTESSETVLKFVK